MQHSQVSRQISCGSRFLVWFLSLALSYSLVSAGTNVPVVASVSELGIRVDVACTNAVMTRVILPGIGTYTNYLDIVAYSEGFDSDFLAALPAITNQGLAFRPVEVREPTNMPRQRFYLSMEGIAVHTTTVNLANYPTNWVESTYGTCPSWLTGAAKTQWFSERDPSRQRVCLSLISTSDVPAWLAAMTNIGHSLPGGQTNMSFLDAYSNDIALAGIATPDGIGLLLHAPTNTATLDLYTSTNLMDTAGWRLYATLEHATDPLLFDWYGADPQIFFAAGDPGLDTDNDGLADTKEFFLTKTDPTLPDTVGDGLGDFARIMTYGLSANSPDSDGDGLSDAYEIAAGLNPQSGDSDGDGLSDYAEVVTYYGYTSPTNADSDADGLNDYAEIVTRNTYAAPYNATDNDAADTDNDRVSDLQEVTVYGTDPRKFDSDNDGLYDNFEITNGLNPMSASDATHDADGDGFSNLTEYQWNTDPTVSNTYPSYYRMTTQGPGTNEVRRQAALLDTHNVYAMADLGPYTSLIRVLPRRSGTNFYPRQLAHTGTPGFRVNGTPIASLPSPIAISAGTTAVEFRVTADAGYAGSHITFTLEETNGDRHADVVFYSPKIPSATFRMFDGSYTDVNFNNMGALWTPAPLDSNLCRLHIYPNGITGSETGIRDLRHTDWLLARVYGPGATPSTATLNELDWRSAYASGTTPWRTRGIQLVPGVNTVHVGIDANANSILETSEVHTSCKVYVPLIDLTVDSDNDGTITTNDNMVEDALPGKIIFKDKDAQAFNLNTNDSDIVPLALTFDLGGATVPEECYVVLEWMPTPGEELVDVFVNPAATNPLSWTGFHPTYSNQTVKGHLFDVGDTIPSNLYLRASMFALAPYNTEDTITHTLVSLICYRRDTKKEVCRDTVKVSIANRPAVTPKNDKFYVWAEERDLANSFTYASMLWNAVSNNLSTNAVHDVPYRLESFQTTRTNLTTSNFAILGQAGILVTAHHGGPGSMVVVAFPQNSAGMTAADNWVTSLGSNWATRVAGYGSHAVAVESSYIESNWKPQRDANNAMFWTISCSSAIPTGSLSSVISAAGGAFACGSTTTNTGVNIYAEKYSACLTTMRTGKWRTAIGACRINNLYSWGFTNVGHGRITLWPAPLRNTTPATYPQSQNRTGVAYLLLDTMMRDDSGTLVWITGDARMIGSPQWVMRGTDRCGLRWPFINDTSTYPTRIRAVSDHLLADPWLGTDKKKMLAGDGKTCGMNIEWEF